MAYDKEGILRKLSAMVSSLYTLVLWVAGLSSLMQSPKALSPHHYHQVPIALTTLISSTSQNWNRGAFNTILSYLTLPSSSSPSPSPSVVSVSTSMPPTPLPSPAISSSPSVLSLSFLDKSNSSSSSSSWSNSLGDLLGTESGIYVSPHDDILPAPEPKPYTTKKRPTLREKQRETMMKEFPPPIPLLARTGNLRGRMPWVLTREYVDNRLILREVSEERYEYFDATREDKRLVLNLIPLPPVHCGQLPIDMINKYEEDDDTYATTEEEDELKEEIEVKEGKKKMVVDHHMVQKEAMVSNPSPSFFEIDATVQCGSPSKGSCVGVGI